MARLHFNSDHDCQADWAACRAGDPTPANANTPAQAPAAETPDFDLDDVFEEPSRRPF